VDDELVSRGQTMMADYGKHGRLSVEMAHSLTRSELIYFFLGFSSSARRWSENNTGLSIRKLDPDIEVCSLW
jgi:hypothetical protein